MKHLKELFQKDRASFDAMLDGPLTVSEKLDGTAFKACMSDGGRVTWHKRSGDVRRSGPELDTYTRAFVPVYDGTIARLEKHTDVLAKYASASFETFPDRTVLLAAFGRDGSPATPRELSLLAVACGCDLVKVLADGRLTDAQRKCLTDYMEAPEQTHDMYLAMMKDMFPGTDPKVWTEGVVIDTGRDQYKLVDPKFTETNIGKSAARKEKAADPGYGKLYEAIQRWAEKYAAKLSPDRWKSLALNFLAMMRMPVMYNTVFTLASALPDPPFSMGDGYMDPDIKRLIEKRGTPVNTAYDCFLRMYWKPKKRNYIISKEFQARVDDVIAKI